MDSKRICTSETMLLNGPNGNLNVIIQKPELEIGVKYPCIILMHGLLKDSQAPILVDIAKALVKEGYITVRFDFDGCGKSDGDFEDMTISKETEDARAVYDYCRILAYVSDISLIGHSQGGVIATLLASDLRAEKIRSLVLLAPAASVVDQAKAGDILGVKFDTDNLPDYIQVGEKRLGREFIKNAQVLNLYERAAYYTGPVCLIHGKNDQIVKPSYSEEFQKTFKNSEIHLIDNEDHPFTEAPQKVVDIIYDFLIKNNIEGK